MFLEQPPTDGGQLFEGEAEEQAQDVLRTLEQIPVDQADQSLMFAPAVLDKAGQFLLRGRLQGLESGVNDLFAVEVKIVGVEVEGSRLVRGPEVTRMKSILRHVDDGN